MKVSRNKIQNLQDLNLWTDKKLAEVSGVSCPTVYALKSRGSCAPATAGKLATAFNVPVSEIIPSQPERS